MIDYNAINKQFGFYKVFELINNSWNINNPIDPVPKIRYSYSKYKQTIDEYWINIHSTIGERGKFQAVGEIRFILTTPKHAGIGKGVELMAFLARIVDNKQIGNVWTDRLTLPDISELEDNDQIIGSLIYHVNLCG